MPVQTFSPLYQEDTEHTFLMPRHPPGEERGQLKDWTLIRKRLSSLERIRLIYKRGTGSVLVTTQQEGANEED